jgi:uncharacterized protein
MNANRIRTALVSIGAVLLVSMASAAVPQRPDPARFVNDLAGVFQTDRADSLEGRLAAYSDSTSTQIVVVTVSDLEGMDAATYATEIGESWGVGSSDFDNGAVILVKPKNDNGSGEVFIATGYGLEGAIPDAYAKRIINEIMIPKFIENDYFAAVEGACDKIIRLADGEEFVSSSSAGGEGGSMWIAVAFIVLILYLVFRRKGNGGNGTGDHSGGNGGSSGPSRRTTVIPTGGMTGGSTPGRTFGGGSFGGGGAGGKW